jgi:hypothetical protein
MCLKLVGILTASINLGFAIVRPPVSDFSDAATGAFTITIKCGSGTTVMLNAGDVRLVFCYGSQHDHAELTTRY